MKIRLLSIIIFVVGIITSCSTRGHYVSLTGYAQGGTYAVTFNTAGATVPVKQLAEGIDSILTCIDTTLSGYNPGSMLSRYNRGEIIAPSPMFEEIFAIAKDVFTQTDSTVDVAAAPLFDLWGFGFTEDKAPSDSLVAGVMARCGMELFSGDLTQASPGQKLNYNAIAQGYSADKVAEYLQNAGVTDMLVDIGEIFCCGKSPAGRGWRIAIDTPFDGNMTPGAETSAVWEADGSPKGIVTSGNYRKYYLSPDGQKISHTIDPRTGRSVSHNLLSATVIADDSCTADAAATACMVMGLEKAKEFVVRKSYEAFLIYSDEEGLMKSWNTEGLNVSQ